MATSDNRVHRGSDALLALFPTGSGEDNLASAGARHVLREPVPRRW
jgi:hypothetical protein